MGKQSGRRLGPDFLDSLVGGSVEGDTGPLLLGNNGMEGHQHFRFKMIHNDDGERVIGAS